jgi:hypothetical protein
MKTRLSAIAAVIATMIFAPMLGIQPVGAKDGSTEPRVAETPMKAIPLQHDLDILFAGPPHLDGATKRPTSRVSIKPGTYHDPEAPGVGVSVEFAPPGDDGSEHLFVTFYGYDSHGAPMFLTAQGRLDHGSPEERFTGYRFATFEAPLLSSTGGQCIGCQHQNPTTVQSEHGNVTIEFTSPSAATVRLGGHTWRMKSIQNMPLRIDYLGGRWRTHWEVQVTDGGPVENIAFDVYIKPANGCTRMLPYLYFSAPGRNPSLTAPQSSCVKAFFLLDPAVYVNDTQVDQAGRLVEQAYPHGDVPGFGKFLLAFWGDPQFAMGVTLAQTHFVSPSIVIGPSGIQVALFAETPNRIVGEGFVARGGVPGTPHVGITLVMERIVD